MPKFCFRLLNYFSLDDREQISIIRCIAHLQIDQFKGNMDRQYLLDPLFRVEKLCVVMKQQQHTKALFDNILILRRQNKYFRISI
jgi:hypothetical protein